MREQGKLVEEKTHNSQSLVILCPLCGYANKFVVGIVESTETYAIFAGSMFRCWKCLTKLDNASKAIWNSRKFSIKIEKRTGGLWKIEMKEEKDDA